MRMGAKKRRILIDGNFLNGTGTSLLLQYLLNDKYFGSSKTSSSLISTFCLLFLDICSKVVFLDKPKIASFAFEIHTGEYILCSFGLFVRKLTLFTFERYFE